MNLNHPNPGLFEIGRQHKLMTTIDQWANTHLPSEQVVIEGRNIAAKGHADYLGRAWRKARFDVVGVHDTYRVVLHQNRAPTCTCPGGRLRPNVPCKHRIAAILEALRRLRARGGRARGRAAV